MRLDGVLFTGSTVIAHPLLDRLFAGALPPRPDPLPPLSECRLVVVDARLTGDDLAEGGIAQRAAEAGVALLVVAPNEGQMAALARIVGSGPHTPVQAVFVTSARHGDGRRYDVRALGYPVVAGWDGKDQPPRIRIDQESVVREFALAVEIGVERGHKAAALAEFPDGLRWFMTTWGTSYPLSYYTRGEYTFENSGASFTLSYTMWAFLSETPTETKTIVIAQGTNTLNPGTLAQNNEQGRAVMNMWFQTNMSPRSTESGFISPAGTDHIPTSGDNSWDQWFEVPISYASPFGGYNIYIFTARVADSISSWSVHDTSNGAEEGSQWYVNSPVNGLTFPEGRSGAFTGSGHLEPFPAACTGKLIVDEASAWEIGGAVEGLLRFRTMTVFRAASIYTSNCGGIFCYDPESETTGYGVEIHFDLHIVYA